DEVLEQHRLAATQVDDLVAETPVASGDHAGGDVVHEGPVAVHVAAVVQRYLLAAADAFEHLVRHHVAAPARAVHGEEAHGGEIEREQVVVGKAEHLGGSLAGRVGGQRAVGVVRLGEGHACGVTVRGRGGRADEVRFAVLARGVQKVEGAGEIDIVVEPGVFDRNADAGHGGQVGDGVE